MPSLAKIDILVASQAALHDNMADVLAALTDTSIPLDERWDAYTKLVESHLLFNEDIYGDGYLGEAFDHNRVSLYDDFNMDRHETRTYPEMWDAMNEEWFQGPADVYGVEGAKDKWRELVLASGYSGFCYDW